MHIMLTVCKFLCVSSSRSERSFGSCGRIRIRILKKVVYVSGSGFSPKESDHDLVWTSQILQDILLTQFNNWLLVHLQFLSLCGYWKNEFRIKPGSDFPSPDPQPWWRCECNKKCFCILKPFWGHRFSFILITSTYETENAL